MSEHGGRTHALRHPAFPAVELPPLEQRLSLIKPSYASVRGRYMQQSHLYKINGFARDNFDDSKSTFNEYRLQLVNGTLVLAAQSY